MRIMAISVNNARAARIIEAPGQSGADQDRIKFPIRAKRLPYVLYLRVGVCIYRTQTELREYR
jgi:hypothetical protein